MNKETQKWAISVLKTKSTTFIQRGRNEPFEASNNDFETVHCCCEITDLGNGIMQVEYFSEYGYYNQKDITTPDNNTPNNKEVYYPNAIIKVLYEPI